MNRNIRTSLHRLMLALPACLLMACSAPSVPEPAQYDLGPLKAPLTVAPLPALALADVAAPGWLEGTRMVYRLAYANEQQVRAYAHSSWAMPPARLFEQRLKARLAQHGVAALSAADGASNLPVLRIELDEYSQVFDSATHSSARVTVRVAVLRGHSLLAQQSFAREVPAATPDAPGGAAAIARASDAVISDLAAWLATHALK